MRNSFNKSLIKEVHMDDLNTVADQSPIKVLAGALAHLATHMENGCYRSAYLAVMLFEQIVADPMADAHLRQHAWQLIDIFERLPTDSPARAFDYEKPNPSRPSRPFAAKDEKPALASALERLPLNRHLQPAHRLTSYEPHELEGHL
jgi:uncharacterized protein (UPF0147 family)